MLKSSLNRKRIEKVTDPAKIVTDPVVLHALRQHGLDERYVELKCDCSQQHPAAKFYRDRRSDEKFAVFSSSNRADQRIACYWELRGENYVAKSDTFAADTTSEGRFRMENRFGFAIWHPQVFLNGVEQKCGEATLLSVDPITGRRVKNTLEWDYGICKRRARLVSSGLLDHFFVYSDPRGELSIKLNYKGTIEEGPCFARDAKGQTLELWVEKDVETIPASAFKKELNYPIKIASSPKTFDNPGIDGWCSYATEGSWAACRAGGGDYADDSNDYFRVGEHVYLYMTVVVVKQIFRGIPTYDTSSLSGAILTSAAFYAYGADKDDSAGNTPTINVYSSAPASNTALVAGDYDSLGSSAWCDSAITYAAFSTSGYNSWVLNATGLAAINKEGYTCLGLRDAKHDVGGTNPSLAPLQWCYFKIWSEEKGAGYEPKLVVSYTRRHPHSVVNFQNPGTL